MKYRKSIAKMLHCVSHQARARHAAAAVQAFSSEVPAGTRMVRRPDAGDGSPRVVTVVRAQVLGDVPVVWVQEQAACIGMTHILPIEQSDS